MSVYQSTSGTGLVAALCRAEVEEDQVDPPAGWSLHLGLPKTASTLLQKHLFGCHLDLDYLGKLGAKWVSPEVEKFVRCITKAQGLDDSLARGMREGYIEPALRGGRLPVLSNEGLSAGLPELHEKRAEFLKQVWSPCSVLFFIRHPLRLVESLYFHRLRQYARKGMSPHMGGRLYFDVNEWLEANLEVQVGVFNLLDYARTIQVYCRILGRSNVGVFLFEELTRDLEATMQQVCGYLGVTPATGLDLAREQPVNPRWTEQQVLRLKEISSSRWRSGIFRAMGMRRRDSTLAVTGSSTPARLDWSGSGWIERIEKQTAAGNRWLAQTLGLPLARYKYPM